MLMCIVWEGKPMRKMFSVLHYEYKMQFKRLVTWGVLLVAMALSLLDNFPSAGNLARLEFLNEPAYFVYRIVSLDSLVLLFGLMRSEERRVGKEWMYRWARKK